MTAPERDDEFEAFLKRRTLLPDMVDPVKPPDHLDEAVLNEARRAIRAEGRPRQPVRAARWARPVALAATILLCLSIVLNVTLNTNRPGAGTDRLDARTDRPADAAVTGGLVPQDAARSVAAPAPVPQARRDAVAQNSGTAGLPAAQVAKPAAPSPSAFSGPGASGALADSAGPPPPAMAGARVQGGMRQRDLSASAADIQTRAEAEADKLAAPAATAEPLAEQKPAEVAKRKAEAQPLPHPQDPKVWLQQIETLRSHGKTAQADAEMQRFRDAFPTYPVEPRQPDTP